MEESHNWEDPPDPPIVGKVTHFSIELIWNKELLNSSSSITSFKSSTSLRNGVPRTKYIIQEEELGGLVTKGFGTVYGGFAHKNTFTGLEPRTLYRYRIKYKGDAQETPWSRPVEVCTTKKPPSVADLHKAVLKNDIKTCKSLLNELKPDTIDAPDKYGYTPLMSAVFKDYRDMAEVLIQSEADVNFQNSSRRTPLMVACVAGKLDMVKLLRKNGAKWTLKDNTGCTPLHYAVDGGNSELVRWAISNGCEVDEKDHTSGWTPLMRLASTSGDLSIARILVQHKANLDVRDSTQKSVLMMAALNGHTSMVKLLLDKGATVGLKSVHNKTALDFATSFDHRQIIQLLEEKVKQARKDQQKQAHGHTFEKKFLRTAGLP